jgi:hypothetical protein
MRSGIINQNIHFLRNKKEEKKTLSKKYAEKFWTCNNVSGDEGP